MYLPPLSGGRRALLKVTYEVKLGRLRLNRFKKVCSVVTYNIITKSYQKKCLAIQAILLYFYVVIFIFPLARKYQRALQNCNYKVLQFRTILQFHWQVIYKLLQSFTILYIFLQNFLFSVSRNPLNFAIHDVPVVLQYTTCSKI